jgi:N-methylhydantoinase A
MYGYAPDAPEQVVTFRVTATSRTATPLTLGRNTSCAASVDKTRRRVYFKECGGFVDCWVYDRAGLTREARISGPAILNQMDSTTVILPDQTASIDETDSLIITFR